MKATENAVFKFEDIEFRPAAFLLRKAGTPLSIEPKAFRVLEMLILNRARMVKKEELLDAVWPETNVTENSLTRCIAGLRRQLGDDAREPRFIVTVHTEGYRFVCPIVITDAVLDPVNGSISPAPGGEGLANGRQHPRDSQVDVEPCDAPPQDEIAAQLKRILASATFANSSRSQRFLRYVVESSLKSEEESLKEYTIAVEVFDRNPSYDPSIDATVRVEAGRLRARLSEYYRGADPNDRVMIDIPKGAYRASFTSLPVHDSGSGKVCGPKARLRKMGPGVLVLGAVVATGVLIAGTWIAYRTVHERNLVGKHSPKAPVLVVQLTNLNGNISWPAFSPDGKQIAFVWDAGVHPSRGDLYVQFIAGEAPPLRLTHTRSEYVNSPTWLPNGREVSFPRCDDNGGAIYVVSALGGPEHRITDIACPFGYVPPVSWTSDGKTLVMADSCIPGGPRGIVVFSMDTGARRCLIEVSRGEEVADSGPVLSPDGKTVAFVRALSTGPGDLYTVPLAGGTPTRLTTGNEAANENFSPMWTTDGQFICFNSTRSGPELTWRIPAGGGAIQAETVYPGVGALSPDGSRLVYTGPSEFGATSVWRAVLTSEGGSVVGKQQLLPDSSNDYAPRPSPEGREIVFESLRAGPDEIWKSNADGSDPRKLTWLVGIAGSPRWSADGKWIAFDFLPVNQPHRQIFVMDADGRNLHMVVSGNYSNGATSWSNDGKAIYFASDRTGAFQVWRHELATGNETQLTHDGGLASMESFDGKTLYFSKLSGGGIWAIAVNGGQAHLITDALHFGYWGEFAVTEHGLYLVDSDADPGPTLMYYSFQTHQLKPILVLNGAQKAIPWSANLGASRDGKTVLVVLGTFRNSLVMAENLE